MNIENIWTILENYKLDCSSLNYNLYKEFAKNTNNNNEIIDKIIDYNDYVKSGNNKYSEEIIQYLRQRYDLNKFDYSSDDEINKLSPNEVFEHVVKWNGLLGEYHSVIKAWVKEIYGVDLNKIMNKMED